MTFQTFVHSDEETRPDSLMTMIEIMTTTNTTLETKQETKTKTKNND